MLPFDWSGATQLPAHPDGSPEAVLRRLADGLRGLKAEAIHLDGDGVTFHGGVLRWVLNWNLLLPISTGRIEAAAKGTGVEVRYRLWFTDTVAIGTVQSVVMGALVAATMPAAWWQVMWMATVVWAWLVGGNLMMAVLRFPGFVERTGTTLTRWPPDDRWYNG